jgi:hypothetical protein
MNKQLFIVSLVYLIINVCITNQQLFFDVLYFNKLNKSATLCDKKRFYKS